MLCWPRRLPAPSPLHASRARLAPALLLAAAVLAVTGCARAAVPLDVLKTIVRGEDLRDPADVRTLITHEDAEVRERAILALGRIGLCADAPRLLAALDDPDARVRVMAVFALGETFDAGTLEQYGATLDPAVPEALRPLLDAEDRTLAARAAEALGKIRDAASVAPLCARLGVLTGDVGAAGELEAELIMTALLRLKSAEAIPALSAMAASPVARLRADAANAISRIGAPGAGLDTALALLDDPDPTTRANAVRAVGTTGTSDNSAALLPLLDDPSFHVRYNTVRALQALGGEAPLVELRARFGVLAGQLLGAGPAWIGEHGEEANLLVLLIDALGTLDDEPATLGALDSLRIFSNAVGFRAELALARIAHRLGMDERLTLFPEGYKARGHIAVRNMVLALQEVDSTESLLLTYRMLRSKDAPITVAAALRASRGELYKVLKMRGAPKTDEMMIRELELSDRRLRASLAGLLSGGETEDDPVEEAYEELVETLRRDNDPDPNARMELLLALERYGDREQTRAVAQEIVDKDFEREPRAIAVRLLGRGADPDVEKLLGHRRSLSQHIISRQEVAQFYDMMADVVSKRIIGRMEIAGRGAFAFELFPGEAPLTVLTFYLGSRRGLYNTLTFHRVVPNFVVQGGDPLNDMTGGPGHTIPCEINTRRFERGTMGMALSGKDTGGSQFFICHAPQPHLDGGYTAFGRVLRNLEGVDVPDDFGDVVEDGHALLDQITQYDVIGRVTFALSERTP